MNVRKKIYLELYLNNQYIWLKITVHNYIMAYLHCRIGTQIQTRIRSDFKMAILHYAEVFTLHGFKFQS